MVIIQNCYLDAFGVCKSSLVTEIRGNVTRV